MKLYSTHRAVRNQVRTLWYCVPVLGLPECTSYSSINRYNILYLFLNLLLRVWCVQWVQYNWTLEKASLLLHFSISLYTHSLSSSSIWSIYLSVYISRFSSQIIFRSFVLQWTFFNIIKNRFIRLEHCMWFTNKKYNFAT